MFRATEPALSKASRLPLTSKKANKDFYKGGVVWQAQAHMQVRARAAS